MKFQHDCDACVFLGSHTDKEGQHDFYYCLGYIGQGSVIARYGDRGSEYQSMAATVGAIELFEREPEYVLAIAYRKAKEQGFIKG